MTNLKVIKKHQNFNYVRYYGLLSAIPSEWKHMMRTCNITTVSKPQSSLSYLSNNQNTCRYLTGKFIEYENANRETNHKFIRWEELFGEMSVGEWQKIFELPFKVTIEVKLRNFQYKLLNRIVCFNEKLHKWGKVASPMCDFCEHSIDGICHRLFECEISKIFWESFSDWMYRILNVPLSLNCKQVIFGTEPGNPKGIVEHLLLIGKYFIYKSFIDKRKLYFPIFLEKVKYCWDIEHKIAIRNSTLSKFEEKWNICTEFCESLVHTVVS